MKSINCNYETCGTEFHGVGSASYDLAQGSFSISAAGSHELGGRSEAILSDEYELLGVAEGTYPVGVEIHVVGSIEAYYGCTYFSQFGTLNVILREEASNQTNLELYNQVEGCQPYPCYCSYSAFVDTVLQLSSQMTTGQALRLTVEATALGSATTSSLNGRVKFSDLPPGTTVRSCQGYLQEFPVPTASGTWGRIKARYR